MTMVEYRDGQRRWWIGGKEDKAIRSREGVIINRLAQTNINNVRNGPAIPGCCELLFSLSLAFSLNNRSNVQPESQKAVEEAHRTLPSIRTPALPLTRS